MTLPREGNRDEDETKGSGTNGGLPGVLGRHRPRGLPRGRMAVGRGRLHRHAHVQLFGAGLPRFVRHPGLHEGQPAGEGGGRPAGPLHERQAVHALPQPSRGDELSRPAEVPHETRTRRPRQRGRVRAHHVGRGAGHHRGLDQDQHRRRRPGPRVHHGEPRHRPQHQLPGAVLGRRVPAHLQRGSHRLFGLLLLPAARVRHGGADGRLPYRGRVHGPSGPLQQSRMEEPGRAGGMGLRAAALQRRRLHWPLAGAVRADGDEDHLRRPHPHLVGRPCHVLA